MIPPVIIGAAISVAASTIAWLFRSLTEEEKRRQESIRRKIQKYKAKYNLEIDVHNEKIGEIEKNAFQELSAVYLKEIAAFRKTKSKISDELNDIQDAILEELKKEYISPSRRSALIFERNRINDALSRLNAYWEYLEWFEFELSGMEEDEKYANIFQMEPPQALLPEDYMYVGMLCTINEDELKKSNKYNQILELTTRFANDKAESSILEYYRRENITDIPVLIENFRDSSRYEIKYFKASIAKGEIYNSILYGTDITVQPQYNERPNESYLKVIYKGVKGKLYRENKERVLKNYRSNYQLQVRVLENDYLLREIFYTEKIPREENWTRNVVITAGENINSRLEKLSYLMANFNLMVCSISSTGEVILKLNNLDLVCRRKDDHLELLEINENDTPPLFEAPFIFHIVPSKAFEPGLFINLEDDLETFLMYTAREMNYKEYSENAGQGDHNFFRNWYTILQYQLNNNSYEELSFDYTSKTVEHGFTKFTVTNLKPLKQLLSKNYINKNNKIKVLAECKPEGFRSFENHEIGVVDDLNFPGNCIIMENISNGNSLLHLNSKLLLRVPVFQGALTKQLNAMKQFNMGKIINKELKSKLIFPSLLNYEKDEAWTPVAEQLQFLDKTLTVNQQNAIKNILAAKDIYMLQGPPGTGKTTVIVELVYQYIKNFPGTRLLIVSQQNVAVDNALEKIYKENRTQFDTGKISMVRIAADETKVSEALKPFTIETWFEEYKKKVWQAYTGLVYDKPGLEKYCTEWKELIDKPSLRDVDNEIIEVLINSHKIIGATCVGLANKSIGLDLIDFDIAIIDEAGRATLPEMLIPLIRAKKVILIGDHYQLPPQYDRRLVKLMDSDGQLNDMDKSLLDKSFFEKLFTEYPATNTFTLKEQFRMPPDIGNLISNLFYKDFLKNGINKDTSQFWDKNNVIRWIDVKGRHDHEPNGTSLFNAAEAEVIGKILKQIDDHPSAKDKTVAVITFYSAQKRRIREELKKYNFCNIKIKKVDTIDSFQGEQAHIVVYSTVKSKGVLSSFLIDKRRLNVAISRTQENLIFVGDKEYLRCAKAPDGTNLFNRIITYIDQLEAKKTAQKK